MKSLDKGLLDTMAFSEMEESTLKVQEDIDVNAAGKVRNKRNQMIKSIKKNIFRVYKKIGSWYLMPLLRREWKKPPFDILNERPIEYSFALNCLAKLCPKDVLDVGAGTTAWPHLIANCGFNVTAIDEMDGYWKGDFFNRHYYIMKDDIINPKLKKQFDALLCISVLEHIPDHLVAMTQMFGLLRPGGHLILTLPYNEDQYFDNVYAKPGAGYGQNFGFVCQVFSREEINEWLNVNSGLLIDQQYYQIFEGDYWTFGDRIYPPLLVDKDNKHQLSCLLIQKK